VRKRSSVSMARCVSGTERSLPADRRETLSRSTDVRPNDNDANGSFQPSDISNVRASNVKETQ